MNAFTPGRVLTGEATIGLVNNLPEAASAAADAQFTFLLQVASRGRPVRLRRFAPAASGRAGYEPIESLWRSRLDGLIVTGAEPRAERMTDEPSWPLLARLVDWAAAHTQAAIWSCLAAHAAVFRLDGVARRRLPTKLSGVFTCRRANDHALLEEAPPAWPVPHSRCNDVDVTALERAGYTILSRGPGRGRDDGADAFAKAAGRSTFLMMQGHPEYAADTLMREYCRDARRWRDGGHRPVPPSCYFDAETEAVLAGAPDPAACLAAIEAVRTPPPRWLPDSVRLFETWLSGLDVPMVAGAGLSRR